MISRFFIFLCFSFSLPIFGQSDSVKYQLLWEIKGKGLKKPSYLFGSFHSNDARLFQFPDSLYTAFVQADAVVLETDISSIFDEIDVRLDEFGTQIFDRTGTRIQSNEATRTVYGSEDGRPQFLDAYFQQTAYCANKQFFQLESVQDQKDVTEKLGNITPRAAFNSFIFSKETFTQTYIQGDIVALHKMLKSQLNGMPGAYEALISNRNKIMANGLDTLMHQQTVFCAVGTGHLYGIDGILQLLRSKGYTVRAVNATFSSEPIAEKRKMQSWNTYLVKNTVFQFELPMNGKPLETIEEDRYHILYQELGQGNTFELTILNREEILDDCSNEFVRNTKIKPEEITLADGTKAIQGLVKDPQKGFVWKRIFIQNGKTYELVCYGGNKFMHSDRPKKFFNRLKVI